MNLLRSRQKQAYSYNPIDLAAREVRLIRIGSSSPFSKSTVNISLHAVSLENSPPFAVVSYVPDKSKVTEAVICDDLILQVPQKVDKSLRSLRDHNTFGVEFFWIDYISIDQLSIEERERKSELMRSIYLRAELNIGWLDIATTNLSPAVKFATQVARIAPTVCIPPSTEGEMSLLQNDQKISADAISMFTSKYRPLLESLSHMSISRYVRLQCRRQFNRATGGGVMGRPNLERDVLQGIDRTIRCEYFCE